MKGLVFTYALSFGGAIASLINPFYGLLVYVTFAIVRPETMWFWSVPVGNYSRIVACAMLIGWAARGFGNWRFGRAAPVVWSFLGLYTWGAISAVVAATNTASALDWLEVMAKILLPFLVGVTMVRDERQLRQLAWAIVGSLAYVAFEMNLAYYRGWNRMHEGYGSLDNNVLSIAMVGGIGFAFFLGVYSHKWWQKAFCVVASLAMAHSIMFAYSRGGMLGMVVLAAVMLVLLPKSPKYYFLAFAMIAIGYRLMGQDVIERFMLTFSDAGTRDSSAQSRLDMWRQCMILMGEHPIFGIGPDNWGDYAMNRFGWGYRKEAHSLWLQTGAELGFVGLFFLLSFYATCAYQLMRSALRRRRAKSTTNTIALAVVAALSGFAVSASFVTVERLEVPYYIVLVGAMALKLRDAKFDAEVGDSQLYKCQ